MALFVPNASELILLEAMLSSFGTGSELVLKLYKNDVTPSDSTNLVASFTEATFTGYSEVELDPAEWTYSTVSNKAKAVYGASALSWTVTGAAHTVYGYYVTDQAETNVIWAERFLTPWVLATDDQPMLSPSFSLHTAE